MVENEIAKRFLGKLVGIELIDSNLYYKGYLRKITDSSLILEMLNEREIVIALSEIKFMKEVNHE